MAAIPTDVLRAARRYGSLVDDIAAGYRNPKTGKRLSGTALLLKLSKGENAFRMGGKPSSAGARGATQFTPGSRQVAIDRFGVDPWKDADSAFHAAALHLQGKINGSKGLKGYNPGMASYTDYILNQSIGDVGGGGTGPAVKSEGAASQAAGHPMFTAKDVEEANALAQSLSSSLAGPERPKVSGVPAALLPPSVAQSPGQAVIQGGNPGAAFKRDDVGEALKAVMLALPDVASAASPATTQQVSNGPARTAGEVVVRPGSEARGVKLQKPISAFLKEVSSLSHRPVTVTTATNHSRLAASGNVSDHWAGNAADLGLGGDARQSKTVARQGDLIAAHAIQAATGMKFKKAFAVARRGGIHNFETKKGRVQIIWRAADHYDHVHVGLNPNR